MVLLTVLCHADAICRLYFHLIFPMCMSTDSTVATVYWEPPQGSNGLTWYDILVSSDGHQSTHNLQEWSRRYTVNNLSPETVYLFQVRAVTSQDGNG